MEIDTKQLRLAALAYNGRDATGQSLAKTLICIADYIDRLKELIREQAHTIERLVSEAANTPDLLKQLAETRGAEVCYNETISDLRELLAEAMEWKKAAQSVMLPYQDIARELNIGLGESIHDKVLPCIVDLKSKLAEARAEVDYTKQVAFPKRIEKLRSEARQEAAREIICKHIEFFLIDSHDRSCLIRSICKSFKLEG